MSALLTVLSLLPCTQGTKKLVSDSPGLVDFAVGLVDFTLNLPEAQVKALGENSFEEIRAT